MLFNILRDILKTPAMDIILHLKRSTGMSVNEIAKTMDMSYQSHKIMIPLLLRSLVSYLFHRWLLVDRQLRVIISYARSEST